MKTIHLFGIFIYFSVAIACIAQVGRCEDLGDGYDAAVIAKPSNSTFESIGHFQYLRYKEKELCNLGYYELSPDKRFIAFQEGPTGKIFLLDKKRHSQVELVSKFPGLVRKFDWKAKDGFLKIEIYEKDALMVSLPRNKAK